MTTQPEALRLADELEFAASQIDAEDDVIHVARWFVEDAAAELRRLSAVEAELLAMRRVFSEAGCTFDVNYIRRLVRAEAQRDALLEALRQIVGQHGQWNNGMWVANIARAAIAKAEGGQ